MQRSLSEPLSGLRILVCWDSVTQTIGKGQKLDGLAFKAVHYVVSYWCGRVW